MSEKKDTINSDRMQDLSTRVGRRRHTVNYKEDVEVEDIQDLAESKTDTEGVEEVCH